MARDEPATCRLPTGVLVFVAVAVLLLGGAWWSSAAPATTSARAAPADASGRAPSVQVIRTSDGSIVSYTSGRSTIVQPTGAFDRIFGTRTWVCQPIRRSLRPNLRSIEHGGDGRTDLGARTTCGWVTR